MSFLLNNQVSACSDSSADETLLVYLRDKAKLTGTKEGCASGDCGACTVVVGELNEDGTVQYHTVNSCVTPVHNVKGKHVVTVEHLASENALHPVQKAMLEAHGSQCGFCTPGFVMSLANLYENKKLTKSETLSKHEVQDAISGNLCRCTGYRPIIDAGLNLFNPSSAHDGISFINETSTRQLAELATTQQHADDYLQPNTLNELSECLAQNPSAKLIAGGTDLMLEVTQRFDDIPVLIDLSNVNEMRNIKVTEEVVELGAGVTYSQMESSLKALMPEFCEVLHRIGSRQIRNRGTVGGNIANASPIADLPPMLLALNAQLSLLDSKGQSRTIPLNTFYLGYKQTRLADDEVITKVQFEKRHAADFQRYYKVSKRMEDDISSVFLAVRFTQGEDEKIEAHIAYGGMAATPIKVAEVETLFNDIVLNDLNPDAKKAVIETAKTKVIDILSPMSDVRASAAYRSQMAANLLEKAWREFCGETIVDLASTKSVNYFDPHSITGDTTHA